MPAFSIDMSSPMPSGNTGTNGGPGVGGHVNREKWYIQYGMDLSGPVGTRVYAAFDAHITVYHPHDKSSDSTKEYGAQIFARSENDKAGVFYQHITSVPAAIKAGAKISRGDLLGEVYIIPGSGMPPHLHWALVEIIGGAPGGRYVGVNLHTKLLAKANSSDVFSITFNQNGTPPSMT
ncbi:M23 family metallopeptidase [Methylobacterium dankookense]|uniref:M23 family metallopeptidase n=1 Tax=Methylobacterium dankookense TaxID=560405 RepID=UPI00119DF499|nr:M23 family metallopeptidase [Methylobacterium dankookense]